MLGQFSKENEDWQANKQSFYSILKILYLGRKAEKASLRNKQHTPPTSLTLHPPSSFSVTHHQSTSHTYQGGFCGTGVFVAGEKEISSPEFTPE